MDVDRLCAGSYDSCIDVAVNTGSEGSCARLEGVVIHFLYEADDNVAVLVDSECGLTIDRTGSAKLVLQEEVLSAVGNYV